MVGWTLRQIGDAFHDHGFSADTSLDPPVSGQRRSYVEQRDGFVRDDAGRLRPQWATATSEVIENLSPDSAIPIILRRMWDDVERDPDAAIGAAEDVIEATAKHVLDRAGEPTAASEKMPKLVSRAHDVLGVHAKTVDPSKPSASSIQSILGALSQVALGINELRREYGTGRRRTKRTAALTVRHARLAAQAADAWVHFMLDTDRARADAIVTRRSRGSSAASDRG